MTKLNWVTKVSAVFILWVTAAAALPAQIFTTLYNFDGTDGANPYAGLVKATNGNFYGTTTYGGANGDGTVFEITPSGTQTVLYSFAGPDGANPYAGLAQSGGFLYGTTYAGGTYNDGTVFKIQIAFPYMLVTMHSFSGISPDGANPYAVLVQSGSFLYGTTYAGGSGNGTVFMIEILFPYTLTTMHSFSGISPDGANPYAGLVQCGAFLYGTTYAGGSGDGTVFMIEILSPYTLTTMHSFSGIAPDGANPYGGLVQNGAFFYGTTYGGGAGHGAVFKTEIAFPYTTLPVHLFSGIAPDGANPYAGLVQNGTYFFGTTYAGGANGSGTLFEIQNAAGYPPTTLYSFPSSGPQGANPYAGLVLDLTNMQLYGTTYYGGIVNTCPSGCGTLFQFGPI
jgi:uncharacterized repeat protein (TIGR03803 family)